MSHYNITVRLHSFSMKTINLSHQWNKAKSYKDNNPYAVTFVFAKNGTRYVIKGGVSDNEKYLKDNEGVCFIRHVLYKKGVPCALSGTVFGVKAGLIGRISQMEGGFRMFGYDPNGTTFSKNLRRFPQRFPDEFQHYQ